MMLRAAAIACLLGLASGSARAQHADAQAEAKQHYQLGITHYNLSEFDEAIAEFKAAYELSRAPGLLYNIAQAYRLKGDLSHALETYRNFVRLDPSSPYRGDAETRIAELEKLEAEQKRQTTAPPVETIPPETEPEPEPGPGPGPGPGPEPGPGPGPRPGRTYKIAGIATGAAGVVLLSAGIVFGMKASSQWDDIAEIRDTHQPWGPGPQDTWDSAESNSLRAKIFIGTGVAAVAGGAVLYYLGMRQDAEATRVTVAPARGGAVVGWSCAF